MANTKISSTWPLTQRLLHWGIVLSILIAWWSAGEWDQVHDWSGYILFALMGLRVLLAIFSKHINANGIKMFKKLATLPKYLKQLSKGQFVKTRGLSPMGVITVLLLVMITFIVNYTGLMLTFDDYVGEPWLEQLHADLFYYSLGLVAIHVVGAVFFSLKQKENKFKAMIFGGK